MKKYIMFWLIFLTLICCKSNTESNNNSRTPLITLIDSLNLDKTDLKILIDKSDYKLYVVSNSKVIRAYESVFGTNPIDDKLMEGDRCTPEGQFKVRALYPHKAWSKFIWINYPTDDSWKKHKKAKLENRISQNAKIGGEIGIHGVPNNSSNVISEKQNWTWGCISLSNDDINDLYEVVYKNMSIEIIK